MVVLCCVVVCKCDVHKNYREILINMKIDLKPSQSVGSEIQVKRLDVWT